MKNNNLKNKNKFFLIFIVILFLIFLGSGVLYFTDTINKAFFPFQKTIFTFGNNISEIEKIIKDYKKIIEENKILKNEKKKMDLLLQLNEDLENENERLRNLLDIKSRTSHELKVAKVNFKTSKNLFNRFYIELPENSGIEKNMLVFVDSSLIGKIQNVYSDFAVVEMITTENYRISAITESGVVGLLKGNDEGNGELYFEPTTFENDIKIGEKVYTSGMTNFYPKGIYIGKISDVNKENVDIFKSIKVKSDINMMDINEVLILKR